MPVRWRACPVADRSFRARFDSLCLWCDKIIKTGEWVCYNEDGKVVHEACHVEGERGRTLGDQ